MEYFQLQKRRCFGYNKAPYWVPNCIPFWSMIPLRRTRGQFTPFANDASIYYKGGGAMRIIYSQHLVLEREHDWCRKNKFTVHPRRTKAMLLADKAFKGPIKHIQELPSRPSTCQRTILMMLIRLLKSSNNSLAFTSAELQNGCITSTTKNQANHSKNYLKKLHR